MFLEHLHCAKHCVQCRIHTHYFNVWVMLFSFQKALRHREVKGLLQCHTAGEQQRHWVRAWWDDKKLGLTCVSTAQKWRDLLGGDPFGPESVASLKDHTLSWLSYSGYKRTQQSFQFEAGRDRLERKIFQNTKHLESLIVSHFPSSQDFSCKKPYWVQ